MSNHNRRIDKRSKCFWLITRSKRKVGKTKPKHAQLEDSSAWSFIVLACLQLQQCAHFNVVTCSNKCWIPGALAKKRTQTCRWGADDALHDMIPYSYWFGWFSHLGHDGKAGGKGVMGAPGAMTGSWSMVSPSHMSPVVPHYQAAW